MKYTVIDFETANSRRNSACAIGLVVVEDGQVIEERAYLIQPHDMIFEGMNIAIHGIRPEDVVDAPTFDELYLEVLKPYLENQLVVAHNASFDISVLRACLSLFNIPFPTLDYLCTVKVAQKCWEYLPRHSLDVVSKFLGFEFKHHDAYDDARACANVLIKAAEEKKITSPYHLAECLGIKMGKLYLGGYQACSTRKK